ncbi:hypothetical protein [Pectobacterium polaris]|uniref:hypothetical protein n=1 Tax=Pectobacterium polaris TaxID=2042057 RepID=UPI00142D5669|nr:hypothetical protein [Pectobacterium polaris]
MHRYTKKSAAYVGSQPQLPSGSQLAFSFPLLNDSMKKPLNEGLFFGPQSGQPDTTFPVYTLGERQHGQSALSKTYYFD